MATTTTAEHRRLADSEARRADWKKWGPYLADRAWGTVREDYSADGDAWSYFPHEHAHARAYRWNEDGLAGFCNRFQNLCLAVALWNEREPILKERLFGLANREGNHGEDVKECYWHLDGTPTHSYMKMLYRYPQVEYPYDRLVAESGRRGRDDGEFELTDALGPVLGERRFFDVFVEYAKAGEEDILCRVTAVNRGPDTAPLHLLPHLWYRNAWSFGYGRPRPELRAVEGDGHAAVRGQERHLGERWWYARVPGADPPSLLFTDNDTNVGRVFGAGGGRDGFFKDGIHEAVVAGRHDRVNAARTGTKVAAHARGDVRPGGSFVVEVRFSPAPLAAPFDDFGAILEARRREADEFWAAVQRRDLTEEERRVQRRAFAGLLWNKQFYHYGVELWLEGDPASPPPPAERRLGRNADWTHLYNLDVVSMPDKWEYPWYAAWDLAFHAPPLALIDPEWAKRQLVLMLREWYMHPNGQLPAYEWNFGDVNPPVHAWSAWRVYKIDRNVTGEADTAFLERVFQKLLLNFTWWVNRKDTEGRNIFGGGFLGLDNIGIFDRSDPPGGVRLEQADGTAWMGMYCLNMLAIALELARTRPPYEDMATKFFEHFIWIADALNRRVGGERGLWDDADGFYYDRLRTDRGAALPLRIRSFVGLIPLFAVETLDPELLERLPRFRRRMEWFIEYRPRLVERIASLTEPGEKGRRLLSLVDARQLERVMERVLDEAQFLSPHGVRSLSREHGEHPFELRIDGKVHSVRYEPAESRSRLFGGNSNWRGPVWFPLNFLLIESLQKYHHYYGDRLRVELPRGSGRRADLEEVARDLARRLIRLFLPDGNGRRPFLGDDDLLQTDPLWRDEILFHEYFDGETGKGLGASHQSGWTALVAKLIQQCGGE